MIEESILWRRLDSPGHDACRLERLASGWQVGGAAVFLRGGVPSRLDYRVRCNEAWVTIEGFVQGWVGDRSVFMHVIRDKDGEWSVNGKAVPGLDDCVDLDLGFTPATNALSLRRLALPIGESAAPSAAWVDVDSGTLAPLSQRYERREKNAYWYEAPRFDYAGLLEVSESGLVQSYPSLWRIEA